MDNVLLVQGRCVHEPDIIQVRGLIAEHPTWSRRQLSLALAHAWHWRTDTGRLKDMAARSLLGKLEQRGMIVLPPRRKAPSRRLAPDLSGDLWDPVPIVGPLADLAPLRLSVVTAGQADHALFARYLAHAHYLGYRGPVGENLAYLVRDRHGREVACVLFGAAAWKTQPRDAWIGWDDATRARRLSWLTNNTRFLILPWVHVPHLASHLLGQITRRLAADWHTKYGHAVYLVETFVERERFRGTCYRAANWTYVGCTKGRSRQDRYTTLHVPLKDLYLYPLTPRCREALCRVD